jgi:aminoglycoside 6'-N-acetyltransferase I
MAIIRPYTTADFPEWRRMRTALWSDQSEGDMAAWLARPDAAVFVAELDPTRLCGFAEVGARLYVDACNTSPVAYLEGWYVDPEHRRRSIGARLVQAIETWARSRHYRELASDTELHNVISQRAHQRLGFTETERHVLYRKAL